MPWALTRRDSYGGQWRATQVVRYAAPATGAWGSCWLDADGLPVWHELPTQALELVRAAAGGGAGVPRRHATGPVRTRSQRIRADGSRRLAATSTASASRFADVELDLDWCTPFQRALADALRAVPSRRDRHLRRAGRARRPAAAPRARRARSARATASRRRSRATASSRRRASAATARSASSTSGGCWSSRSVPLSEELRRRARGDRAAARLRPARRALRRSSTPPGSLHLRGRGEVAVHLDLASSAVARRAFSLLRGSASSPRSAPTGGARSTGRRATSSTSPGATAALDVLARGGRRLGARTRRSSGRRGASSARACCRGAYLRGALLGGGSLSGPRVAAPRDPDREPRGRRVPRRASRPREDVDLRVLDRGRHAAAYAKGAETIADVLALAGASDAVLALEERAVVARDAGAREPARERRPREPRPRRAAPRTRSSTRVRELERDGRLERLPPPLREIAELRLRHPSLSLRELAAKCRPPATKAAVHRRLRRLVASPTWRRPATRSFCRPHGSYSARRVCARPATDSDPVCRLGPERGATGGEGRPRSFPSGPPLWATTDSWARARD